MRVFVAIELAPVWQEKITKARYPLRQTLRGKWVEQHNLHLTLAFIGEVKDTDSQVIAQQLKIAIAPIRTFELVLGNIVTLPPKSPRLIAFSFKPSADFLRLQQAVINSLKKIKIPASSLKPHLTLVRLKSPLFKSTLPVMPALNIKFTVNQLSLMQSTLTPKGPVYKRLEALKLSSKAPQGPLRPNIAICIINPKNEVLLIKHREHIKEYWQFPQGGVKTGDSFEQTVKHELKEELGLLNIHILKLRERIYKYNWPKKLIRTGQDLEKKGYIGQEQSLAIVKVNEIRPKLTPDPREAAAVHWFPISRVMKALNPIRRPMGKLAMVELNKMITKGS